MKKWMFFAVLVSPFALSAESPDSCSIVECHAGDQVVTFASKDDPYYACPTLELSEYVNGTLGMVAMTHQLTGTLPNISPKTGEPEFKGSTKDMIDSWREAADVSTFDEAFNQCAKGKNKVAVMIMNSPQGSLSAWVADKKQNTFWLPKGYLNRR